MDVFKGMLDLLAAGESFVVAAIVSRSGSAPRAVGTRMVLRGDGSIIGTIGGGILEARVQELGKEVLASRKAVQRKFVLTAEEAGQMGMICGGQLQVLLQFVDASDPANTRLYEEINRLIRSRKRAWLMTELPAEEEAGEVVEQHLWSSSERLAGRMELAKFQELTGHASIRQPEVASSGGRRILVECLCHEGAVYIFGAGHISQKLAPLTTLVGFQTVVLDDRVEFANAERFPTADELIVLESFDGALDALELYEDSFLVLVTRGHAHDKTVLAEALKSRAGYIGMIGSRRKRDAIYEALRQEGFSARDFERVFSPVGLDIGAETPEEIAVSIVAELIQVRAGKNS